MTHKPLASLSLDLDNLWSYLETHGDPGWETFPSYLDLVVPRFLKHLAEHELTITVFGVGQDAALAKNRAAFQLIGQSDHEVGCHAFQHHPWMNRWREDEVDEELAKAEDALFAATGKRPRGFRGPGFALSTAMLNVLARRGYLYDASTFPTYLGPLARAYYFMTAKLPPEEKARRKLLFGRFADGTRSNAPYRWRLDDGQTLLELPVTTFPGLKIPIHLSYVLYLASFSRGVAMAYFETALKSCALAGLEPSILLHPLDFLGGDDVERLSFFPAMALPGQLKLSLMDEAFTRLKRHFQVVPLGEHARRLSERPLPHKRPAFACDSP